MRSRRVITRVCTRVTTTLACAVLLSGAFGVGTAEAYDVESGSLSFSGDAGEYVSGGQSYAYADGLTAQGYITNGVPTGVGVFVDGADGGSWALHLETPAGAVQPLAPGTYSGAAANPDASRPRIELRGNGRDCLDEGSFTVQDVDIRAHGYVKKLDATFEQHCPGATESLRGEVHVANPEPPAETALGLDVAPDAVAGRVDGHALVHGTVTCTEPVALDTYGTVSQTLDGVTTRGTYRTKVGCVPGGPTAWTASAVPSGSVPFQRGDATVIASSTGKDPFYGHTITAGYSGPLQLTKK
ncbi:hypothetical protein [Streptomyces endophyticus]|uniref:Uncharacterized protein n=1 Tax=Streptomyces endophyticus TaxID=714166 RepID=A0ABU6FJL7_9ACTN|nr:hypothetical protein [Streptomyces endophyticus]MEB8344243.1 hypothetical protein [Streptomyces endophyticus]